MANATPSRAGQVNQSGDVDSLFLKVYAGEVLTAFKTANKTMGRHHVRTIESGKSAQFPVSGKKTAAYHTPGAEITGDLHYHNEVVVTIDDLLIASSFIANIDEAKNHYDVRSIYSSEDGIALANQMDRHVLQAGILGARNATPNVTGGDAGTIVEEASSGAWNTADTFAASLFDAAQALDEHNVPDDDRYCFVDPQKYYTLVQSEKAINRDFGGKGAYSDGTVFMVAGLEIVKTNQLPRTNITTGVAAGTSTRYAGDFTNNVGLVMHKSAIGTVKLMDLAIESDYDIRRQGHLMVAKYACGHKALRPEALVELQSYTA